MVVRTEHIQDGQYRLKLRALGRGNHLYYGVNIDTSEPLTSLYSGEEIILAAGDVLYYEECNLFGERYKRQLLYFDGNTAQEYYPIPHIGNIYANPEKIDYLRLEYLEKRDLFLNAKKNRQAWQEQLKEKQAVKNAFEEELMKVEIEIEKLKNG